MPRPTALLAVLTLLAGCSHVATAPLGAPQAEAPPAFSLFSGSSATLDEAAVARLLDSRVEIPAAPRVAVLQAPDQALAWPYGYYGRTEEELRFDEAYLDTLRARLLPSGVREMEFLPSLLVPQEPTIPVLREVGVRLQADLLLVFRVSGDLFENYRVFRSDEFKAYATCEAVLLDVRTGAIPFTTVVTREHVTQQREGDLTAFDAQRRARQEAVLLALGEMGREVAAFLQGP